MRRRSNVRRVAEGKKPLKEDKSGKLRPVSAKSIGLTKGKAKVRLRRGRKNWKHGGELKLP